MTEEAPTAKVNFNREMDGVVGDNVEGFFKNQIINILKNGSTVTSISETEALRDLRGDIARSEGPIELTRSDVELLEDNIDRGLSNESIRAPNRLVEEILELINSAKEQLSSEKGDDG